MLHHITAFAGDAARNHAFYTDILGLRLVKKTVNFDDPSTYHLYYGDAEGRPGTLVTHFPMAHIARGKPGTGETALSIFAIPRGALDFWQGRLEGSRPLTSPFGETILSFEDPDGMKLALKEEPATSSLESTSHIVNETAITHIRGVTLQVAYPEKTAAILKEIFGYTVQGSQAGITRLVSKGEPASTIDLVTISDLPPPRQGAGSVHHIAFRASDDAEQAAMVRQLIDDFRLAVTPQKDRNYFRSVYFREPNGVLFEIATDGPGFAVDEPLEHLGEKLMLPPALEGRRAAIESGLMPL